MTPLDKTLKRTVTIKQSDYVVTLSPVGLKLTQKGHRRGLELLWESLVNGESALAVALQASLGTFEPATSKQAPSARAKRVAAPKSAIASRQPIARRRKSVNRK